MISDRSFFQLRFDFFDFYDCKYIINSIKMGKICIL